MKKLLPSQWTTRLLATTSVDVKYALLEACLIGLFSALAALLLKYGIGWLGGWRIKLIHLYGAHWTLPLVGLSLGVLAGWIVEKLAPAAAGGGIPQVKAALARHPIMLNLRVAVVKTLGTILVLGAGLTLGRRGPTVHIGAALAAQLSRWIPNSPTNRRQMIAAGAAAGLAAGFNAPIAGVFFAVEVVLGTAFTTPAASLILLSAFISSAIASSLLGRHPALELPVYQVFSYWEWLFYLGLGLLASLVAFTYTQSIKLAQASFQGKVPGLKWLGRFPMWIKPVIGGIILGTVALQLPQILGVDYGTVEQILTGSNFSITLLCWLLIVKLIATAISLGSGFVGGVFAPAMFLGACLGATYGNMLASLIPPELSIAPPPAYAIVGMAAVLAASVNAPLTAITLLFELTQSYSIILPLMAAVGVSVWMMELIQSQQATKGLNLPQMGMNLEKQDQRELLEEMLVAEIMSTSYLAMPDSLSMLEAAQKILTSKCHTALIVDKQQQLVGIVTLNDIKSNILELNNPSLDRFPNKVKLQDICTSEILCTYPEETISSALERMGTRGLYLLPVVDQKHPRRILGVINKDQIYLAEDLISTQAALSEYLQHSA